MLISLEHRAPRRRPWWPLLAALALGLLEGLALARSALADRLRRH